MGQEYLDCYIRVSTSEQEKEGHSLDSQELIGRKVAEKLGLKFRLRNEGARSSTIGERQVLSELKSDIQEGLVKNIWCFDRSRMFRDLTDSSLFNKFYVQKFNVNIYEGESATLRTFDTPTDKLHDDLLTRFQQYENEIRKHRSQTGKRYLLEHVSGSKSVFLGGTATFGYANENKEWVINKDEAKWVKFIFNSVLKGKSTKWIKDQLDINGVSPRRTKSGLWSLGTLQKMLSNESYTGIKRWYDKDLEREFVYEIPQIITVSVFNRVRKEMKKRQKLKDNKKKHFSLLSRLLMCECGEMIGSQVKQGTRKNGQKYNTRTYYCLSKSRQWRDGIDRGCKNKLSMDMDKTNEFVLESIKKTVSDSVLLREKFKWDVIERKREKTKDINQSKKKLEQKCRKLQGQMERTIKNIARLETEKIQERKEAEVVNQIISNLEEELKITDSQYQKAVFEIEELDNEQSWLDWLTKYGEDIEVKTRSSKSKKDFINSVVDKIIVRSEFGEGRDGKQIQVGHSFDIYFMIAVVDDKLIWKDESRKSLGYDLERGHKKLSTGNADVSASKGRKKKPSAQITVLTNSVTVE